MNYWFINTSGTEWGLNHQLAGLFFMIILVLKADLFITWLWARNRKLIQQNLQKILLERCIARLTASVLSHLCSQGPYMVFRLLKINSLLSIKQFLPAELLFQCQQWSLRGFWEWSQPHPVCVWSFCCRSRCSCCRTRSSRVEENVPSVPESPSPPGWRVGTVKRLPFFCREACVVWLQPSTSRH